MARHFFDGDEGWINRRFRALEQRIREQAAARPPEGATFASDWAEDNAMSVPVAWTDVYSTKVMPIPTEFWYALVQIEAMVGDSFSSSGNISCAPLIKWIRADATSVVEVGPTINSGNSNVAVANTFYNRTAFFGGLAAGASPWSGIQLGVRMIRVGTELSATSGNWHLSGAVIYRRGVAL